MKKILNKHIDSYCKLVEIADSLRILKYSDLEPGKPYTDKDLYGDNYKLYKSLIDIYLEQGEINRNLDIKYEEYLDLIEENKELKKKLEEKENR